MAKPSIKLRTAYDSPGTLVFRCQKSWRNSNDITPNKGAKWRWGRFESGDLHHRTLPLRRSTAAILYSSAMTDANDAFTVAERYRPTAINNVRSKSITGVVYINSRCASTVPSALALLVDECQRYSKPKHCRFRDMIYSMTERTISGVRVSPGSAETLVRRGRITNHHLIAYSFWNISTKITKIG